MSGLVLSEAAFERVGLFPLPDIVLFPRMRLPLHVFEPRYRRLVEDAVAGDGLLAIPRLKPGFERDYYGAPPVFEVFGVGTITEHFRLASGRWNLVVEGIARVRLVEELSSSPYRLARVAPLEEFVPESTQTASALRRELLSLVRRLGAELAEPMETLEFIVRDASSDTECADALAAVIVSDADERQLLLELLDPVERLLRLVMRVRDLLSLAGVEGRGTGCLN